MAVVASMRSGRSATHDRPDSRHGRRRTVLFLLPSLNRGGAEVQAVEVASGLSSDQWRALLVTFERGDGLSARVAASDVSHVGLLRSGWLDTSLVGKISTLIDKEQVDVVHCTLPISLFFGAWAAARSRRRPPLVAALHTTRNHRWQAELLDWVLYRWLLQQCESVVFVCEAQRTHWCAKFPELRRRAVVIHNGVDIDRFDRRLVEADALRLRTCLSLGKGPVICQVAGFRPEKGHRIMIDAFRALEKEVLGVQLLLVGDGPLRHAIQGSVASESMRGRIHFLGALDDVRPVLANSDCSVLPSTRETFSMAMLESLAMGVPVVATDVGGMREAVVDGETGSIVPPADAPALFRAIRDMLRSERRREEYAAAGRALIMKHYRREGMIQRTSDVLREVAERVRS